MSEENRNIFFVKKFEEEEREYLESLHLPLPYGGAKNEELDYSHNDKIIRDKGMKNIFMDIQCFSEYREVICYLIHNSKTVWVEFKENINSKEKQYEFIVDKIEIPDDLWEEKETIIEIIKQGVFVYEKDLYKIDRNGGGEIKIEVTEEAIRHKNK